MKDELIDWKYIIPTSARWTRLQGATRYDRGWCNIGRVRSTLATAMAVGSARLHWSIGRRADLAIAAAKAVNSDAAWGYDAATGLLLMQLTVVIIILSRHVIYASARYTGYYFQSLSSSKTTTSIPYPVESLHWPWRYCSFKLIFVKEKIVQKYRTAICVHSNVETYHPLMI